MKVLSKGAAHVQHMRVYMWGLTLCFEYLLGPRGLTG